MNRKVIKTRKWIGYKWRYFSYFEAISYLFPKFGENLLPHFERALDRRNIPFIKTRNR